jgi:hypothetical protein
MSITRPCDIESNNVMCASLYHMQDQHSNLELPKLVSFHPNRVQNPDPISPVPLHVRSNHQLRDPKSRPQIRSRSSIRLNNSSGRESLILCRADPIVIQFSYRTIDFLIVPLCRPNPKRTDVVPSRPGSPRKVRRTSRPSMQAPKSVQPGSH